MKSYWFIFDPKGIVLEKRADGTLSVPVSSCCPLAEIQHNTPNPLPHLRDMACQAVQLTSEVNHSAFVSLPLRTAYGALPNELYTMAGKAREILYWDGNTRFCGCCGHAMERSTDISKRCPQCGKEVWPSLAVAIIVLVSRGNEALLVQSNKFRGDYYGLVSGFVETGETLEQCVHREVKEETGVDINHVRYVGSQVWPFPNALMVAFRAEYEAGEVHLQYAELNKGGWFDRQKLPALPQGDSIARRMIEAWRAGQL